MKCIVVNQHKPNLLVILGPTAVGKTEIALEIATVLSGEIISADSMQVYRGMNVGTAKPSAFEQQQVPHHLIDIANPDQRFTVVDFLHHAQASIDSIIAKGKLPILAGGTGLYINALIDGFAFPDQGCNQNMRQKLAQKHGNDPQALHQALMKVDQEAASKLHPNDTRRIIRALEVYHTTGKPISVLQQKTGAAATKYEIVKIGLNRDRQTLYQRIEARVDLMIKHGLVDEVIQLLQQYPTQPTALQAIGYKEIALYLQQYITIEEAIYLIKRDTRRYAKRQLSWFRRDDRIQWFDVEALSVQAIVENIVGILS